MNVQANKIFCSWKKKADKVAIFGSGLVFATQRTHSNTIHNAFSARSCAVPSFLSGSVSFGRWGRFAVHAATWNTLSVLPAAVFFFDRHSPHRRSHDVFT
jgi:hypothetical protein